MAPLKVPALFPAFAAVQEHFAIGQTCSSPSEMTPPLPLGAGRVVQPGPGAAIPLLSAPVAYKHLIFTVAMRKYACDANVGAAPNIF